MDPTQNIDPVNSQTPELSDDQHAAALGYITTLTHQMMPQDEEAPAEGEEMPQPDKPMQAPGTKEKIPQEDSAIESNIIQEIRTLKADLGHQDLAAQFQVIKNEIESVLNEDEPDQETKA